MKNPTRLRSAVFLTLLAAGLLGMLATGSGVWPGPSWPWLALLAVDLAWHAAQRRVTANERLARRIDAAEHAVLERDKVHELALQEMGARVAGVWTSDTGRRLVENQNRMAETLTRLDERAADEDRKRAYQRSLE